MANVERKHGLRKGKGWARIGSKALKRAASKGVRALDRALTKNLVSATDGEQKEGD